MCTVCLVNMVNTILLLSIPTIIYAQTTCTPTSNCPSPTPTSFVCESGTCTINCSDKSGAACQHFNINCTGNTICNIECGGFLSCANTNIYALYAQDLSITVKDLLNGASQQMNNAIITCPDNGSGGSPSCHLSSEPSTSNQWDFVKINAVEGFNDVEMLCTVNSNCMPNTMSLELRCRSDYTARCIISSPTQFGPFTNCESAAPTNNPIYATNYCESYTYIPSTDTSTNMPTTNVPTNLPTTNYPTTNIPTTIDPTTNMPTTYIPTTNNPTTSMPSTGSPTAFPVTYIPTTNMPTTTAIPRLEFGIFINHTHEADEDILNLVNDTITDYLNTLFVGYTYDLMVDVVNNENGTLRVNVIITSNNNDIIIDKDKLNKQVEDAVASQFTTTYENKEHKSSDDMNVTYIIIIILCVVVVLLILIGLVFIIWRSRKRKRNNNVTKNIELNPSNRNKKGAMNENNNINKLNEGSSSEQMYDDRHIVRATSNGEHSMDDHDSSDNEKLYDNKKNELITTKGIENGNIDNKQRFYVRAVIDYIASDEDQFNLKENEIFFIIETLESGWWYGIDENGNNGWIPSNYVKKYNLNKDNVEEEDVSNNIMDDKKRDNYLLNMEKYLNIKLPPRVIPVIETDFGTIDIVKDEYSDNSDIDNNHETNGKNTKI